VWTAKRSPQVLGIILQGAGGRGRDGAANAGDTAPYGAIYLSEAAHLHGSECGGPEFWSGGNARTVPVPGTDGKIAVAELIRMVDEAVARPATEVPPRGVSVPRSSGPRGSSNPRPPSPVAAAAMLAMSQQGWKPHVDVRDRAGS
jgi:hypothetical protein